MPPARFEPAIAAGDRPQTHDLDRSATGIGILLCNVNCKLSKYTVNYNLLRAYINALYPTCFIFCDLPDDGI